MPFYLVSINKVKAAFTLEYQAYRFAIVNLSPARKVDYSSFSVTEVGAIPEGVSLDQSFRDDERLSIRIMYTVYILFIQSEKGITTEILTQEKADFVHLNTLASLSPTTLRESTNQGETYKTVKFTSFISFEDCKAQATNYQQTLEAIAI